MRKHILIIGNPGEKESDSYCHGVLKDMQNYKDYFMSNAGGQWYESEITTMIQPDPDKVAEFLREMDGMEYSIVVFSGHGYSKDGQTYVELKSSAGYEYDLPESKFLNNGRRLIILDCCRKSLYSYNTDEMINEEVRNSFSSDNQSRRIYENTVLASLPVNVTLYSCGLDEYSNDDSRTGGTYSYSLLSLARRHYQNMESRTYITAPIAHSHTAEYVSNVSNRQQNPAISKPRVSKGNFMPFIIKA